MTDTEKLDYLITAVNELLTRVGGVPIQQPLQFDVPQPLPGEGIASYVMRVADIVGGERGAQAKRAAGALFGGAGQALVDKHRGDWRSAALEFITGDPAYQPDPAWTGYRPG